MLFDPANLTYWIFLIVGIVLFFAIIFLGGGNDELDLSSGSDAEGELRSIPIGGWIGIGKAPILLLLATDFSLWGLSGWLLNTGVGALTGSIPEQFVGLGGVVFFVSLFFSLFVGSLVARIAGRLFASFGEDASSDRFLGCIGTVVSKGIPFEGEGRIGQVNVRDRAGNLIKIAVNLPQWAEVSPHRGQEVVIIDQLSESYLVVVRESLDQQRWLADVQNPKDT